MPINQKTIVSHSPLDPGGEWEPLVDHLDAVANRAQENATWIDSSGWGQIAGLWHDLGKAAPEWQAYIRDGGPSVDHKAAGALWARQAFANPAQWAPLALAILGHHGGLPSANNLKQILPEIQGPPECLCALPASILNQALPEPPAYLTTKQLTDSGDLKLALEMWVRFLFSCLVDADFVETERFYYPDRREDATAGFAAIPDLRSRLDEAIDRLAQKASPGAVNDTRASILADCRQAASLPPGLFSLTVPTGGGKTLSAMSFALRHAEKNGLRRVIVVIPFTSILEQNASVYREALGNYNVIEHHSALDPEGESDCNRLASENWDAPVVVTTSVQFLESLHAHKPSRCRKVHNIAGSVIILDEVQSLPPELVRPTVYVLQELARAYGCSVVLSTATQPALRKRKAFEKGLQGVRDMVDDPVRLFDALKRVTVEWPKNPDEATTYEELAGELAGEDRVLVVTHRRDDARRLAAMLPEEGLFHLSGMMCAAHRFDILCRVRESLEEDGTVRLVSTQLIEAGVDVDFPVVYRVLAGLDSLVQAAGRCNREGSLHRGRFVVYRAETEPPPGTPKEGMAIMLSLLGERGDTLSLSDPGLCEEYFRRLYGAEPPDHRKVLTHRQALDYPETAKAYRLIEDGGATAVVVPYGKAEERLDHLRKGEPSRQALRALQPYTVNLYARHMAILRDAGALEEVDGMALTLSEPYRHLYDMRYGLVIDDPAANPEAMIV